MRAYPTHPRIGIGIILIRDPKILLIKRGQPPALGAWSLPGGAQELGETAETCARRELLEETSLTAGPLTLIGYVDAIHFDSQQKIEYHYTILDFAGHYESGDATPGSDVTDLAWVHPENFDQYNLWAETQKLIHRALSQSRP